MPEKFYVTTPIYYVNARPHIGHAYTTIVADVLARRHRLLGDDVFFLTGTDEHGQKIERSAAAAGIPPQAFADEVSQSFKTLWQRMGITNDAYIRTTDEAHKRGVQKLFADLYERGQIYLSSYTGQYSIGEEMFVEGPPGTIGPDGKPTETVTEENFFFRLSDYQLPLLDLIESDTLKITPESRKNEVLSFLRGNLEEALYDAHFDAIWHAKHGAHPDREEALRQAISKGTINRSSESAAFPSGQPYVPGALKDLSISRSSFTWGLPVPEPAASTAKEKHVIYVWLDALANYMTALGYGSDDPTLFDKFWPADLHLVGKEIIRFHCVYWPAFLLALNPALAHAKDEPTPTLSPAQHREWAAKWLPKAVTAHGWLLFDDSKMSKSKGNIVRTETILEAFGTLCPPPPVAVSQGGSSGLQPTESGSPQEGALAPAISNSAAASTLVKVPASAVPQTSPTHDPASAAEVRLPSPADRDLFAADILRYFLLREIPFGQDGSFTFEALITRYNADLANGYGNLVSRTLNMVSNNFMGQMPIYPFAPPSEPTSLPLSHLFSKLADTTDFFRLLRDITAFIGVVDGKLTAEAPWKLAKSSNSDDRVKLAASLYVACESIRIITAYLYPILPHATANVWRQLGLGDIEQAARNGELTNLQWGGLKPGTKLGPLSPIFPRADKGLAQIMTDMEAAKTTSTPQAASEAPKAAHPTPPQESFPPTDPAAGPRTTTLAEPNPGLTVAGSSAPTTERPETPPHQEAQASGIFAGPADASPQITIDDFAKVELRVAKILVCERIPKADKLLRLEVDLGYEQRQILSGIAEWYTPEDLIGRRIVVITNLAPRKMRGLESHGMLLAASTEGGKPHLASCGPDDSLPLGSRLK